MTSILMTLALVNGAHAFVPEINTLSGEWLKWPSGTWAYDLNVNPADWADSDRRAAIQEAADIFYANPSNFAVIIVEDDDSSSADDNGESELAFTSDASVLCGDDACTHVWYNYDGIIEADVFVYEGRTWGLDNLNTENWPYSTRKRPLQPMLVQQFGFSAGFDYTHGRIYSTMGEDYKHVWTNGTVSHAFVGGDLSSGLTFVYGSWDGYHNLTLSHWAYNNSSGGMNWYRHTLLTAAPGGPDPWSTTLAREPYYVIDKGTDYNVELTIENVMASGSVELVFVASTDTTITTADTELVRYTLTVSDYMNTTYELPLPIPETLPSGDYTIGAIIDAGSAIAEYDEQDNAVSVAEAYVW